MTQAEREQTVKDLLALQRADGGWSLWSLATWEGQRGKVDGKEAPSDGYGTGFVVYLLRQAGIPAKDAAIQHGVAWLKSHQRESGRWFTRSLNTDNYHFITHAGTAYAVLALQACSMTTGEPETDSKIKGSKADVLVLSLNSRDEVVPEGRDALKSPAETKAYLQGYIDRAKAWRLQRQQQSSRDSHPRARSSRTRVCTGV
jgi:hypothetical protein